MQQKAIFVTKVVQKIQDKRMKKISLLILISIQFIFAAQAQYNCQLIGKRTYTGMNLSGSWGWNDLVNNKEYALVGTTRGLSIVDITTPTTPVEVKFIPGSQGLWRECQTWKNHAYITQDNNINANSEGVLIYDLTTLPGGKVDTFKSGGGNDTILKTHSLYIDDSGFLYLNGGRTVINGVNNNGVAIYDLKPDPKHPRFVGFTPSLGGTSTNYVHDCYSRNNIMYQAHIYNNRFTIWDVKDKARPRVIQDIATEYNTIHNMWLSNDNKTLFVSHEEFGFPAEAYDVSDTNNIRKLSEFRVLPNNQEILHNIHVLNDYIIASYYSDGLAIFDASVPDNVITIGYYDTQPTSTRTENGVWGAYGFYKSGLITLSDMIKGLHVIRPTYVRAARIVGTVTDTNTTQPIINATISFADTAITSTSNVSGFYKMGTPRQGTFRFKAEKTGYITKFFNYTLTNGKIDTVNIQLRQIPVYSTKTVRNCNLNTYTLPDGRVVTNAGTYVSTIVKPNGQDSIITTNLIMQSSSSIQTTFCQGTTYTLPSGKTVSIGGNYKDTLTNSVGCDSIISIGLSTLSTSSTTIPVSICFGQNYTLPNGTTVTTGGTYVNTFRNVLGCDSVVTTYVAVNPVYNITKQDSVYVPNTYTLPNGNTVTAPGNYVSNLQTINGCDSVITIQLKVLDTTTITGIKNSYNSIEIKYLVNNGELTIINKTNVKIVTLTIYNSIGTVVLKIEKPENRLFLPNLPKDIYLIEAVTNTNERNIGKIAIY